MFVFWPAATALQGGLFYGLVAKLMILLCLFSLDVAQSSSAITARESL
jgi:hypothetical protein